MSDSSGVPAAWYPDPLGAPAQRWWDGTGWTAHTRADVVKLASATQLTPVADAAVASPAQPRVLDERRPAPVIEVPRAAPVVQEVPRVRTIAPQQAPPVPEQPRQGPAGEDVRSASARERPRKEPAGVEPPPATANAETTARATALELHGGPLLPNRRSTFVAAEVADPSPWIAVEPTPAARNTSATWALVFGVLAVITAALAAAHPGALAFSILAIVAGIVGLVRSRRVDRGLKRSIWALTLAALAAAAVIVVWFWFPDADLASVTWLRL